MKKYQPVFVLVRLSFDNINQKINEFKFEETKFVAVTAYQNERVSLILFKYFRLVHITIYFEQNFR